MTAFTSVGESAVGGDKSVPAAGKVRRRPPIAKKSVRIDGRNIDSGDSSTGSRSVLRAIDILELLTGEQRSLGLAQIANGLGIPKTSCLVLLRALDARGFVKKDEDGLYGLGLRSFEVGAAYLRAVTPVSATAGELLSLAQQLAMTSHFAVLVEDEVVYLAKQDPPGSGVRLASSLGARLPAWTTAVGRAQLALSSLRGRTPTEEEVMKLEEVRRRGVAVDHGEPAIGICCVAVPVFGVNGCCGAIGVSYLSQGGPDVSTVASLLVASARRASADLGGVWEMEEIA